MWKIHTGTLAEAEAAQGPSLRAVNPGQPALHHEARRREAGHVAISTLEDPEHPRGKRRAPAAPRDRLAVRLALLFPKNVQA